MRGGRATRDLDAVRTVFRASALAREAVAGVETAEPQAAVRMRAYNLAVGNLCDSNAVNR